MRVDIYEAPDYVNVTYSSGTNTNFGGDELYCFGEGTYSINIMFTGYDYVQIYVEEYKSNNPNSFVGTYKKRFIKLKPLNVSSAPSNTPNTLVL